MWQLRLSDLSDAEKEVGALIIGSLDTDGYLHAVGRGDRVPRQRLAATSRSSSACSRRIQEFDPPGVAARDLPECLLHPAAPARAARTTRCRRASCATHLPHAREPPLRPAGARARRRRSSRSPRRRRSSRSSSRSPGRDFSDGETRYVTPDVFVHKVGDEYVVTLNEDGLPRLRVSSFYRQMLGAQRLAGGARLHPGEDAGRRVAHQVDPPAPADALHGHVEHREVPARVPRAAASSQLRPLVLKDVANDIGMHESTVSRATAGKYVHTPQGTFELKYFFTSSLRSGHGEEVSAESVKEKIRDDHRQGGRAQAAERPVHRRAARQGADRHRAAHGGEVPRADGHPAVVEAQAGVLSPRGSRSLERPARGRG